QHRVTGTSQLQIALMVALELGSGTVAAPAIYLDDDFGIRPERVDEPPLHHDVARWNRQILFPAKGQQEPLGSSSCVSQLGQMGLKRLPQRRRAADSAAHERLEALEIEHAAVIGVRERESK